MVTTDGQDGNSLEDVEESPSSTEQSESRSVLPDNWCREQFINKLPGCKDEKWSASSIDEQVSIRENDREAKVLVVANGSGVVKVSRIASFVDNSNLPSCLPVLAGPNGCCSPASAFQDGKLDLEEGSETLGSSYLPAADGKKTENGPRVRIGKNEGSIRERCNEVLNSKESELCSSSPFHDGSELCGFSPHHDGSNSKLEVIKAFLGETDDMADHLNCVDCLEENVNSHSQVKHFKASRLEDEICYEEHEEIESAQKQIPMKGESLLRGTRVDMSLRDHPTNHEVSTSGQNIYQSHEILTTKFPILHSDENIVNNKNFRLLKRPKIYMPMVSFHMSDDKKYQACTGDLESLQGLDLSHVLDLIISLDTHKIFIDPVDDSFAPNYSKVIKTPMCFKIMKEKVQSQKYLSWQAFVDDFERICYNAMKYNQIRSKIWRAAKKLLRLGKRFIDKFVKGGFDMDSIKEVADACTLEHILDDPAIEDLENKGRATDGLKNSCLLVSPYSKAATLLDQPKEIDCFEQKGIDRTLRGAGDAEPKCATPARLSSNLVEDICFDQCNRLKKKGTIKSNFQLQLNIDASEVEIEECTLPEAVRVDSDSQATEYSSSFGSSLGEGEGDSFFTGYWDSTEVQSRLRNGSGGLLSPQDDVLVGEPNERKKKPLNQEWKTYRRGIEWRCRWLELRIKALQDQASRYDRFLEESEVKKPWKSKHGFESTSASRAVPFTDKHINQPVLHRKRRRKVEDTIDTAAFMSRHPLFSRYEKKKQEQDDPREGAFDNGHFHLIEHAPMGLEETVQPDESDMDEPPSLMKGTTLDEDSIEELLWNIESLQTRVIKLRNQLNKGTHVSAWQGLQAKNLSPVVLQAQGVQSPVPSPKGILRPPRHRPDAGPSLVGPSKSASSNVPAQKASGSAVVRRRTADYDISNVVMPVSVGAKYVEPVRHAKIETPRWRRLDESSAPDRSTGGSSSDEDTDDKLYMEMHNQMEVKERLHRMPHSLKRHTDATAGMSTIYNVVKARGKVTSMDSIELDRKGEDHENLAAEIDIAYSSASLPKGKRTRRDSRYNFTHSRGRKLLNLFAEPSNIKGSCFDDNLDIKSESLEFSDTEAHEDGIGTSGMQTMDPRHFCL